MFPAHFQGNMYQPVMHPEPERRTATIMPVHYAAAPMGVRAWGGLSQLVCLALLVLGAACGGALALRHRRALAGGAAAWRAGGTAAAVNGPLLGVSRQGAPAAGNAGPAVTSFYVYRAQSDASYPLENVNVADLAGVLWYVHNEVVTSTPRKYHIDRIKRFRISVKNTQEFWNVHHRHFGPFLAFDAGRCTTVSEGRSTCDDCYGQYGFIVGCQPKDLDICSGYLSPAQTVANCRPGSAECRAPLWYALPGPCPSMGMTNLEIDANMASQDVDSYKTADCKQRNPGGRCSWPTGAPDCTYSVAPAGEIFLDELANISDYNYFWNASFAECSEKQTMGLQTEPCVRKKEYDEELDAGVGCSFWDRRNDQERGALRMKRAMDLFRKKYPGLPASLPQPLCDFDMIYKDEFAWPVNHTGATPSNWWTYRTPAAV